MATIQVKDASGNTQTVPVLPANDGTALPVVGAFYQTTQPVSLATSPLPAGAATDAKAEAIRALLAATLSVTGSLTSAQLATANLATSANIAAVVTAIAALLKVDTVVQATSTNRALTAGTTAQVLMPANPARRGYWIQNQSTTATLYISGIGTATPDNNCLAIGPGSYFDGSAIHCGTGAISIISTAPNTPVAAREF